jgi:hypothetical protein
MFRAYFFARILRKWSKCGNGQPEEESADKLMTEQLAEANM